jgi:hypothetical protein
VGFAQFDFTLYDSSGIHGGVRDVLDCLGCDVASLGKHFPTFRINTSLSSSRVLSFLHVKPM